MLNTDRNNPHKQKLLGIPNDSKILSDSQWFLRTTALQNRPNHENRLKDRQSLIIVFRLMIGQHLTCIYLSNIFLILHKYTQTLLYIYLTLQSVVVDISTLGTGTTELVETIIQIQVWIKQYHAMPGHSTESVSGILLFVGSVFNPFPTPPSPWQRLLHNS